jgi:molybdopterin-guanine dinucleotide biosynthesis protein A
MNNRKTALILLGGMATRAGNRPKYLLIHKGESFLNRQIKILKEVTDEIILSCRNEDQCREIPNYAGYQMVIDNTLGMGPTEGLKAGALAARGEYIFVAACDMPFLSAPIISYLFDRAKSADAAIPSWEDGKIEPLHAVYRRDALLQYFATHSSRRLFEISKNIDTVIVPVEEIRHLDPYLQSFTNINDLESFSKLQKE